MAKKPRAKCNPLGLKRKPGMMKILPSEHFPGCNTILSKFGHVTKVNKTTIKIIQEGCIWIFCKDGYVFSGTIMHNMMLRQVTEDECDKDQLWFKFGGQLALLSISK